MGTKIVRETVMLADEVQMTLDVEKIDGEHLDTEVNIDGAFFICGENRHEFAKKILAIVDEYKI